MRFTLTLLKYIFPVLIISQINAQNLTDTLRVMTYNTLNYGFDATNKCPELNTRKKNQYLRTIVKYADPDILGLVKMTAEPVSFSTHSVVQNVLDSVCKGCYKHTKYFNLSGYQKTNMLYYKSSKLVYVSSIPIYWADNNISDVVLHKFYYKNNNLSLTFDTIFISVILAHLKSGELNATDRATEMSGVMKWLNTNITTPGNYVFMGDLNTQNSSEDCYQSLISSSNIPTVFFDPVNQEGRWEKNSSFFANYLTQSTRTTDPGDCGAVGGICNRFDHILVSEPILLGLKSVDYIKDSYVTIGQDGNHTLLAINEPPVNNSVPPDVLNALYYMSNHLPVTLKLLITPSNTRIINDKAFASDECKILHNTFTDSITIKLNSVNSKDLKITLLNMEGIIVKEKSINLTNYNEDVKVNLSDVSKGYYFIEIIDDKGKVINVQKVYKKKIHKNK